MLRLSIVVITNIYMLVLIGFLVLWALGYITI